MRLLAGLGISGIIFLLYPALILHSALTERRTCVQIYQHPCNVWEDAALKSPSKPRAHAGAGYLDMKKGRYRSALTQFGTVYDLSFQPGAQAHEMQIGRLNAQVNIAHILALTGDNAKAEQYLREAWLETPAFPPFAVGLSFYDIQHGRFNEALAIIEDAINVGLPQWPALRDIYEGSLYLNRGSIYKTLGNCTQANADFRHASEYPDIPRSLCTENAP